MLLVWLIVALVAGDLGWSFVRILVTWAVAGFAILKAFLFFYLAVLISPGSIIMTRWHFGVAACTEIVAPGIGCRRVV